jgi:hypothetical protein
VFLAAGTDAGAGDSLAGDYTVGRQLDRQPELLSSEWFWVTTAPAAQLPTERIIIFGQQRWDIENYAFHQLALEWHSDHVFRHDPNAIECFLLLTFLAYNLFRAFFALNLKAAARNDKSQVFWARLMTAELLHEMASIHRSP